MAILAAEATVKNERSGESVNAYLVKTAGTDGDKYIYQGIVAVWDNEEEGLEKHSADCGANAAHGDPRRWYNSDTENVTTGEFDFVNDNAGENRLPPNPNDGWTDDSAAVIPARDGDTITISVKGVSGEIELVVDGEAPEIDDVTPSSGGLQKSSSVSLGFTVSDDGSGLRYDGEAGGSEDDDDSPHNGDGDQHFNEPFTSKNDDDTAGNGATADIEVLYREPESAAVVVRGDEMAPPPTNYHANNNFNADDEVSQYGSNDWTEVTKGVEYQLDMRLVGQSFGEYEWQIIARDRVGNEAIIDANDGKEGKQPFTFMVDNEGPEVARARTGIGYKPGMGETKSRSWIALNFVNEDMPNSPDILDASTVEPSDFTVDGHTVMSVIVPSDKQVCEGDNPVTEEIESKDNITAYDAGDGDRVDMIEDDPDTDADESDLVGKVPENCDFEPRARVYLELADELEGDETPTIQMLGGAFKDKAGNNNITQSIGKSDVQDKIAPNVSVTITSSSEVSNRPATNAKGSFTVRIESDEDLARFPALYFATLTGTAKITGEGVEAGNAANSMKIAAPSGNFQPSEKETNVWEKKVDAKDLPGSGNRIVAVIVTAKDDADNSGNSPGWSDSVSGDGMPGMGEKLDFKKLNAGGFLVEIDSIVGRDPENMAEIDVLPSAGEAGTTESLNPYLQIKFGEPNEYGISVMGNTDTTDTFSGMSYKVDIGDGDTVQVDSHSAVTLTSLKITRGDTTVFEHDPESEENLIEQTAPGVFNIALSNLEVGEYTIAYTAVDDIGNKIGSEDEPEEFEFEVLQRKPYGVRLNPGWNLISLPGDPFNTSLAEVIGDLKANTVLGYQGGEWVTAVRNEDGSWQGTLTEIVGGYGYWVQTSVVEDIEVIIPPASPTQVLPSVPVVSGWNLLGVVDVDQAKEGTEDNADQYFTSLNSWRVAYSYDTQMNNWSKLIPKVENEPAMVKNGKGYWVWVTKAGKLVP